MSVVTNPFASVGAGRDRNPWPIKEWMDFHGIRQADIAIKAGVKGHSLVSRTIHGGANNKKVLGALRDLGCPDNILSLPEEMKTEQTS
ncbi:hypothetical protein [Desulfovibrio sp. UCD-KL4C]|uniref:hypothetical protein n=1 Tax=Desulfovibrio sp. UCD-KL4C TaxID=2578120 RepID=UPI0025C14AD4|nr:hypothetical protein [Desulfovibrio sp. UCD-KL4C]